MYSVDLFIIVLVLIGFATVAGWLGGLVRMITENKRMVAENDKWRELCYGRKDGTRCGWISKQWILNQELNDVKNKLSEMTSKCADLMLECDFYSRDYRDMKANCDEWRKKYQELDTQVKELSLELRAIMGKR